MSKEFERENRYIVLKHTHLAKLPQQLQSRLKPAIAEASALMPNLSYLVIESDWPEYEPAWSLIEARMTGKAVQPPELGGEPEAVGYTGRNALGVFMNDGSSLDTRLKPARFYDVALIDRADVAALLAEIESKNRTIKLLTSTSSEEERIQGEILAERDTLKANGLRYEKLRRWMSSNVTEGWYEVEKLGALAAYMGWEVFDAHLDELPVCNLGLCEAAPAAKDGAQ